MNYAQGSQASVGAPGAQPPAIQPSSPLERTYHADRLAPPNLEGGLRQDGFIAEGLGHIPQLNEHVSLRRRLLATPSPAGSAAGDGAARLAAAQRRPLQRQAAESILCQLAHGHAVLPTDMQPDGSPHIPCLAGKYGETGRGHPLADTDEALRPALVYQGAYKARQSRVHAVHCGRRVGAGNLPAHPGGCRHPGKPTRVRTSAEAGSVEGEEARDRSAAAAVEPLLLTPSSAAADAAAAALFFTAVRDSHNVRQYALPASVLEGAVPEACWRSAWLGASPKKLELLLDVLDQQMWCGARGLARGGGCRRGAPAGEPNAAAKGMLRRCNCMIGGR